MSCLCDWYLTKHLYTPHCVTISVDQTLSYNWISKYTKYILIVLISVYNEKKLTATCIWCNLSHCDNLSWPDHKSKVPDKAALKPRGYLFHILWLNREQKML